MTLPSEETSPISVRRILSILLPALLFASLAFALLFMRSMETGYSHDENQFIASGYLLASEGLLPYLDYPYFHMPNLVLFYALLFLQASTVLFWTRVFSVLCTAAIIALVWGAAMVFFRRRALLLQLAVAAGAGLLLLGNNLFNYGSGRAWNHAASGLLLTLAVLVFLYGLRRSRPLAWVFLTGLLLGAAAGIRLTLITSAAAFGLAVLIEPESMQLQWRAGLRRAAALLGGILVGNLPAIVLFFGAPARFIFGNLTYARLNTQFRLETDYNQAMSLGDKLDVMITQVLNEPTNFVLLLLCLLFIYLSAGSWMRVRRRLDFKLLFFMLLVGLTFLGALLPTPFFTQYLFVSVPVAVLGILYALSRLLDGQQTIRPDRLLAQLALSIFGLAVLFTGLYGYRDLSVLRQLGQIRRWYPIQVHMLGTDIQSLVDHGKILTLAPLFPIEGGLPIYPELASGPFAWRTAPLLTPDERQRYGMVAPADLEQLLSGTPPAAVLLGKNPALEQPLEDYARAHDFEYHQLDEDLFLWVNPSP